MENIDGVVRRVGSFLKDLEAPAGVLGSRKDDLLKKIRMNVGGTRRGVKKSAGRKPFERPKIDVFVGT